MYQFLETIRVDHGVVRPLKYHQQRMDRTLRDFFRQKNTTDLENVIICPENLSGELVKCRVVYGLNTLQMEYLPYVKKKPGSFRLVEANDIAYAYKFADRTEINHLLTQNSDRDDIIIVQNGMITDSSYANLVFRKNRWMYTPENPLLKGTKRQQYLDEGRIKIRQISLADLTDYDAFKCINAMLDLSDTEWIPVDSLFS